MKQVHEITERLSILRIIHAHSMCSRRSIVANDIVVKLKAATEKKTKQRKRTCCYADVKLFSTRKWKAD